ncbi:hypothetical protein ACK3SF_05300 [Candidatus Nanosalina sp. VS9-1]|uniref:hypothetical protein n=1 Tax=Candidatus Nanosalina sp. VS9-1 TaxID=3388566 RepID=UPI0039E176ED
MIVGFNVDSIDASKQENARGNLKINYVPEIENVESASVSAFDEEVAKIDFNFSVRYMAGEEVRAEINIAGNVLWNGDTEKIVDTWEEKGELDESMRAPLMNDMYRKLLSEAVGIADTLSMLPPIPTPQVDQN